MKNRLLIVFIAFITFSCSQFSNSPTSKAWHNMNAKFNASLDAEDYYNWAMHQIDSAQIEDFTQILPILHRIDSNVTLIGKPALDESIRLSSMVAERHSNSRYLDGSYLLLGKARLYKEDLINSLEVFKYVNSNYSTEDARHESLIWMIRAYLEANDFLRAREVADIVAELSLSKKNKTDYFEIMASFHQRNKEPALAAVFLEEALKFMPKSTKKARAHFIAGQLYQSLGRGSLARENWKKVVKNKPTYDLEFNSGIELLMLGNGLGANANADFVKMLEDRKNVDLKDKIYYKMGQAKTQQGSYQGAIKDFTRSVQLASDKTQKASAYLRIADIYHTNLQDYQNASKYYDSTLYNMNQRSQNYEDIVNRARSLNDFVKYQRIIELEDSLQTLALMNPLALENRIEEILNFKALEEQRLKREAENLAQENANRAVSGGSSSSGANKWLFYDQVALSFSRSAFIQVWGNRNLEDNWRRRDKELGNISFSVESGILEEENNTSANEQLIREDARKLAELETQKQAMLQQIPNTAQKLVISKRKQEEAYYQLGKIYRLQFNEIEHARTTFVALLDKFPNSQYQQEVLYFLALMNNNPNDNQYKDLLIAKFPYSSYARQLKRGTLDITADTESNAERDYAVLYAAYQNEDYVNALALAEKGLYDYTGTSLEDKYAMLRIMLLAKNKNENSYRIALMDFIRSYPSSELTPRVSDMLSTLSKNK